LLLDNTNNEETISFMIPDKCHVTQAPHCKISEIDISDEEENKDKNREEISPSMATPSAPKRKRRGKGPLVECEVRRSPRIVELNVGFKQHSMCTDKNCLSCSAAPPVTKHRIVKNLASSFCKINEKNLDAQLKKRKKEEKGKEKTSEADGSSQKKKDTPPS
jgi:hypothetical protein